MAPGGREGGEGARVGVATRRSPPVHPMSQTRGCCVESRHWDTQHCKDNDKSSSSPQGIQDRNSRESGPLCTYLTRNEGARGDIAETGTPVCLYRSLTSSLHLPIWECSLVARLVHPLLRTLLLISLIPLVSIFSLGRASISVGVYASLLHSWRVRVRAQKSAIPRLPNFNLLVRHCFLHHLPCLKA